MQLNISCPAPFVNGVECLHAQVTNGREDKIQIVHPGFSEIGPAPGRWRAATGRGLTVYRQVRNCFAQLDSGKFPPDVVRPASRWRMGVKIHLAGKVGDLVFADVMTDQSDRNDERHPLLAVILDGFDHVPPFHFG